MKRVLALILALVMCLSLFACGEGGMNGSWPAGTQSDAPNSSEGMQDFAPPGGNPVVYDHTSSHPLIDTLYGEWILEGSLSWIVMPTKIIFHEDGTCFAEFPEFATNQTMDLYWGIVPDALAMEDKLYVYIGVEDDIWYIYQFYSGGTKACIAAHSDSDDPAEGKVPINGLSKDGYTGMWFDYEKAAGEFDPELPTEVELTVDNWTEYFDLENAYFVYRWHENAFGETTGFWNAGLYVPLKEEYKQRLAIREHKIAYEVRYDGGNLLTKIDLENRTIELLENWEKIKETGEKFSVVQEAGHSDLMNNGLEIGWWEVAGYERDGTTWYRVMNEMLRIQGTLYFDK